MRAHWEGPFCCCLRVHMHPQVRWDPRLRCVTQPRGSLEVRPMPNHAVVANDRVVRICTVNNCAILNGCPSTDHDFSVVRAEYSTGPDT